MPGHSFAFGIGYPELIVNCSAMYPLETEFWCSSLDISRGEALYSWLEGLLTELTDLLPSTLFHIGGDEVQYQCKLPRYRSMYRWHLGCILLKMPAISLLTGWDSSPKMSGVLATHSLQLRTRV